MGTGRLTIDRRYLQRLVGFEFFFWRMQGVGMFFGVEGFLSCESYPTAKPQSGSFNSKLLYSTHDAQYTIQSHDDDGGGSAGIASSNRDISMGACMLVDHHQVMDATTNKGLHRECEGLYVQTIHKESRRCDARLHSHCHRSTTRDYGTLLSVKLFETK